MYLFLLLFYFMYTSSKAMENNKIITIECCDGEFVEIPQQLAFRSQTIKDQYEFSRDIEYITFYTSEAACQEEENKIVTKKNLEAIFQLIDDTKRCKKITNSYRLKKLFKCAHYLAIPSLLRQLTLQMHQCNGIEVLRQDKNYAFFFNVLKKRIHVRSLNDFIAELPNHSWLLCNVLHSALYNHSYLDLSEKKLESLAGLRKVLTLIAELGISNIKGIKVSNNKLIALNIAKLCKLGIEFIDADNNNITRLVLPARLPSCHIYLSNNHIKNIPSSLTVVDDHCFVDLSNNPLSIKSKKILAQFPKIYYRKGHSPCAALLNTINDGRLMLFFPIIYWWLLMKLMVDNSLYPQSIFTPFIVIGCCLTVTIYLMIAHLRPNAIKIESYEMPIILGLNDRKNS